MSREAILKENFAKHLMTLRKARKLSQEELVIELKAASNHEIDITRSALASYENRKSLPRLDVFNTIARFFDVSMDWMLEAETGAPKRSSDIPGTEPDPIHQLNLELTRLQLQCESYKRESEYYKNEFEKAIRQQEGQGEESRADYLRRMYNYPYWRKQFRTFLSEVEYEVFYGVQNNQSKEQLAERLELDPDEVVRIYNKAREDVLAYFKK